MIVVDTNIVAYLLLPGAWTDSVEKLYEKDSDWSAPVLWKSEFRNVLTLYLRKRIISLEQAMQLQETAEDTIIQNAYCIPSPQVLALAAESACSAYDCEFVALAHRFGSKLITQDKKLRGEFPSTAVSVSDYLSLPA